MYAYGFAEKTRRWVPRGKLIVADGTAGDEFGAAIAAEKNRVAVGAPSGAPFHGSYGSYGSQGKKQPSGIVYLFEADAKQTWRLTAAVHLNIGNTDAEFGRAVALRGDRLLVGAAGATTGGDAGGTAFVFERKTDQKWHRTATFTSPSGDNKRRFGAVVALGADHALVGMSSPAGSATAAALFAYQRQPSGSWTLRQELSQPAGGGAASFAHSVALRAGRLMVGAPNYCATAPCNAKPPGAVWGYRRNQAGDWVALGHVSEDGGGNGKPSGQAAVHHLGIAVTIGDLNGFAVGQSAVSSRAATY